MKYILLVLLFLSNISFSQNILLGKVIGKDENIITGATIYLSKVDNNDNLSYSTSDDDGLFTINFKKNNVKITINALGYKSIEKLFVYQI